MYEIQLRPDCAYYCDKALFGYINKNLNEALKRARVIEIGPEMVRFFVVDVEAVGQALEKD